MTAAPQVRLPGGIDRARFLREYWQKRPLLMRNALPAGSFPLQPEELAGLACESEFESRLVVERGPQDWTVRHGPFTEADFAALPDHRWTLLVQDVDKFVPEVAALIDAFDFVPRWRIDDIMISYATDQGGVGPHTDAYDVFLMQAHGTRRWRLSYVDYSDEDLLPGLEQRILSRFQVDEDWLLEPGDVLYLPPNIAHWGTAEGECMTYSLGFRSPSQQELASDWFQYLVSLSDRQHLPDPDDLLPDSLGQMTPGSFDAAAGLLARLPSTSSADFRRWLGCYFTEPKTQFQILPPDEAWNMALLRRWLAAGEPLLRHPFARIAWYPEQHDQVLLFSQGHAYPLPGGLAPLARLLAERRRLDASDLATWVGTEPQAGELLLNLLNEGILESESE